MAVRVRPAKLAGQFMRTTPGWIETAAPRSELELAWAAGFFDGEGCICATVAAARHGRRRQVRLRTSIHQNEPKTLDRFRQIVGVACTLQPLPIPPGANREMYVVQYDGRRAYEVLTRLSPYLFRKAGEFKLAVKLWNEGCLGRRSGPKGWPSHVWDARYRLARELSAAKGRRTRAFGE